ncbi:MAG: hypothetical protein KIH89_004515 [Candidatus Shapirobacteria bacterium]|nr:hypothetical protein [Candidatus Shapirobacteria bacterium]
MNEWKSRYDKEGQSNFDKLAGRHLHVQDNFWSVGKVLLVVFTAVIVYIVVTSGSDLISGLKGLINLAR